MRRRLTLGILLLAAGVAVALWASDLARRTDVPPFAHGLTVFAPPKDWGKQKPAETGAGETPETGGEKPGADGKAKPDPEPEPADAAPVDLAALYGRMNPATLDAVRSRLDGLDLGEMLPLTLAVGLTWPPASLLDPPQGVMLAIVDDEVADRLLDPLVAPAERGAAVYLDTDLPFDRLLGQYDFPGAAAKAPTARIPPSARCLAGTALVRASAAGRFGLEAAGADPSAAVLALRRPGQLEDAMGRLWPLWKERGVSVRPTDLYLTRDRPPRWLGLGALVLMLAGGSLLLATGLIALGRMGEVNNALLARLVGGAQVLSVNPRAYAVTLAAMMAALAVGAAWGGPAAIADPVREVGAEQLARLGLESAAFGPRDLADVVFMALLTNVILWAIMAIAVPSLVPGLGLVTALAQFLVWGVMLAPVSLTLLDRLPLRLAVVLVEGHAYALVALGSWRVLAGVVRPASLGQERRRQGYAAGMSDLYRLLALAAAVLLVAALVETALLALVSHLR